MERVGPARKHRITGDAIAALLDEIVKRTGVGDGVCFKHRPVELRYVQRRERDSFRLCQGWLLTGWWVDINWLNSSTIVRQLNSKRPVVYLFQEGGVERVVVIVHSASGYAIIAEFRGGAK